MKIRDNAVRFGLFLTCALLLSGCSNGEAASELTLQDQVEIIEAHEQLRNNLIALLNVERPADEQITSDDSLDSVAEFAAGVVLANPGAYPVTDGLSEPLTNLLAGTAEEETPAPAMETAEAVETERTSEELPEGAEDHPAEQEGLTPDAADTATPAEQQDDPASVAEVPAADDDPATPAKDKE